MAEVYLAHDDILDRDVALKILNGSYSDDDEFVERFRREAQSAAGLAHPNIVSIYDRGESDDQDTYYIAMEYLPRWLPQRPHKQAGRAPSPNRRRGCAPDR